MTRTVSFSLDHGPSSVGIAPARVGGRGDKGSANVSPCLHPQYSRGGQHPLADDELMDVFLQMRHSEPPPGSLGDPCSASIMTVTGVTGTDGLTSARQHVDLLVASIHTTMTLDVNESM